MLFSAITLVVIALVSLLSFLLLVETKAVVPGSFGGRLNLTNLTSIANSFPRHWRSSLWHGYATHYSRLYRDFPARLCVRLHYLHCGESSGICDGGHKVQNSPANPDPNFLPADHLPALLSRSQSR